MKASLSRITRRSTRENTHRHGLRPRLRPWLRHWLRHCIAALLWTMLWPALPVRGAVADAPEPAFAQWLDALPRSGFSLQRGAAYVFDQSHCQQSVAIFGTCAGNNPASPYVVIQAPSDGTYIDPYYGAPFSETGADGPVNQYFRLADSDALVVLVKLPPRAAYFGYQSYAFTRDLQFYDFDTPPANLSPDPARLLLFSSLGDDLNNVVIQQRTNLSWGDGWVAFITTSNAALDSALRNCFKTVTGLDDSRLLSEPVGRNVLTGSDADADDLSTLIRYALPQDATASGNWLAKVDDYVRVYRVSLPHVPVLRYATQLPTPKQYNTDETRGSLAASQSELVSLLQNWLTQYQGVPATALPMQQTVSSGLGGVPIGLVGWQCIIAGMNCFGDDQDTDTYRFLPVGLLSGTQTAIAVGIDHTQPTLRNASYVSVSVYDATNLTGIAEASQTNPQAVGFARGTLGGSAADVLDALGLKSQATLRLRADLDELYVTLVARQCTAALAHCINIGNDLIPVDHSVLLAQRAYLLPGATTGADPNRLLNTIVIR